MLRRKINIVIYIMLIVVLLGCNDTTITTQSNENFSTSTLGKANIQNFGHVTMDEGGWIYYSNSADDWKLYKIRTDNTGKQKLYDYPVRFLNVRDGFVYFSDYYFNDGGVLVKMKNDGTGLMVITEVSAYGVTVVNDWLYYANGDDGKVYRVKTDGSNTMKIVDTEVNGFVVEGDYIYYKDNSDERDRSLSQAAWNLRKEERRKKATTPSESVIL